MLEHAVGDHVHGAQCGIFSDVTPVYHLGYVSGNPEYLSRRNVVAVVFEHEEVGAYHSAHRLPHLFESHPERKAAFLPVAADYVVGTLHVAPLAAVELHEAEVLPLGTVEVLSGIAFHVAGVVVHAAEVEVIVQVHPPC